jgi:hypothetical protein
MSRRNVLWIIVALAAGCYRQARFTVVQAAPASLLRGHSTVYIAPLSLEALRVEGVPEATWLAAQSPRQQRIYSGDRALYLEEYRQELARALGARGVSLAPAPDGRALIVRPELLEVSPGFWAFVGRDASGLLQVDVLDGDSAPLDQIRVTDRVKADLGTTSTTSRMRKLALAMADETAKYVAARVRQ